MRPGSYAELFMSQTKYIKVRCLNQLGTPQPFFPPSQAGNFDFGATLEGLWFRRRFFHVHITHFESSLAEMSIFHLLNLVQLELRSASESILPVKIIWVDLNYSNYKVRLMKSSGSEPGLIRRKKKTTQTRLQFVQKGNPPRYPKASTSQCFHKMIHFRHVLHYFLQWKHYAGQDTGQQVMHFCT